MTSSVTGPAIQGTVLAGTTPVSNASVQIYAAGTAGNGSAPTSLLSAAALTDATGAFAVAAGSYLCPSSSSVLYVVSTGGQVGTLAANQAIEFVTVLGACGGFGQGGATLVLNEATTVATAFALRPFLTPGAQLGSTATNLSGLDLAVVAAGNLVGTQTGVSPGAGLPANGTAPVAKLNTLANLLHTCAAPRSASSSGCASLLSAAAGTAAAPTNTLDAALAIANQPAANVATLFKLAGAAFAFSPALDTAPPDWTMAIAYTGGGMNGPTAVSIDSAGKVWVANYFGVASLFSNAGLPLLPTGITGYGLQESYGGAVDAVDRMWVSNEEDADSTINGGVGSLTVLNDSGPALAGNSLFSAGGLNFPISIAFDRNGTAWVVDYGNSHVTVLNSAGTPQSGASGYASEQFAFPVAVALDSGGNGWVANGSASTVTRVSADGSSFTSFTVGDAPAAVAVDAADNVWTANYVGDSLGLISAAGTVLSNGGLTGGGLNHPTGLAIDGAGTAWVANYRLPGVSAFSGASAANPGSALSPAAGLGSDLNMLETFGVAVDAAGNVWFTSYGDNRLVEFVGTGTPVKTPLLGGVRIP